MNNSWSRPTRYIAAVGVVILTIFVVYLSRSVISLLITAALIAVIVRPLINWLSTRGGLPRGLAVALVYLALIFIIPALITLAVPAIIEAFRYVVSLDYAAIGQDVIDWARGALLNIANLQMPLPALDDYIDQLSAALLEGIGQVTPGKAIQVPPVEDIVRSLGSALSLTFNTATGILGAVFSQVTLMIFLFLSSIYMSMGAHTYRATFMRAVPPAYQPEIEVLLTRLGRTWNAFFIGQLSLMLVIGVMSWIGLTILGVPGAPSLGIVAGLLEIIPNIGPVIATIPAVIVALLQGSSWLPVSNLAMALIVIGFYILVQQLENNIIVPRLLGGAVDLPPLVVMTGVLVGATSFGILGALLATPVIASLREILRYILRKIEGAPPYTEAEMQAVPEEVTPIRVLLANARASTEAWARRRASAAAAVATRRVASTPAAAVGGARIYPPLEPALPEGISLSTVEVDGLRIRYYCGGPASGPAVLLLHGGGVDSALLSWGRLLPELARGFRVYAPDFPGYGDSDKPDDFDYTTESLVRFVDRFMERAGIPRAHLVGLSMGGAVALGCALETPNRVGKLVLVDSYGLQRKAPMHALSYLYTRAPGLSALATASLRSRAGVKYALGALLRKPGALTAELVDQTLFEMQRPGAGKAWTAFQNSEITWQGTRTVYLDRLGEIKAPTLIVHGSRDTAVPPECAREAHRRIAGSRLAWIEGAGHWPQRDDPEAFNLLVRAFLEEG